MNLVDSIILIISVPILSMGECITIKESGYSGIIVAINKNVPEEDAITTNIETLFREASPILYGATGYGAYFKEIDIIIPNTWNYKSKYQNISQDLFQKAHFRIDKENPQYGNEPYTLQTGSCGETGSFDFVHLTPDYIKNPVSEQLFRENEIPEYRLIQEWSKFRYGVFDEFGYVGSRKYPTFYFDSELNANTVTGCVKSIPSSFDFSPICKANPTEGEIALEDLLNCTAIPSQFEEDSDAVSASIMYTARIPLVMHYCRSNLSDKATKHNEDAPNRQNDECNGRSTWDVVQAHEDFKNNQKGSDSRDTTPTFRYLYVKKNIETVSNRFVWVLDTSYSMKGKSIEILFAAATRCIEDPVCIPDGNEIGLVTFSTDARILSNLTKVDNSEDREILSSLLPKSEDKGYTAIGKGLVNAIQVFKNGGKSPEGGHIVLLTDGEENVFPKIDEVLPELLEQKVVVSAIAFGNNASERLENLTSSTGGELYLFNNLDGFTFSNSLDYVFLEATTTQIELENQPVTIINERLTSNSQILTKEINIDHEIGKSTVFTIQTATIKMLDVVLIRPNGSEISDVNKEEFSNSIQWVRFSIPEAEPGTWKVIMKSKSPILPAIDIFVRSFPNNPKIQPIRVRVQLSETEIQQPKSLTIFAEVKRDYIPVTNAKVTALISRPNGSLVEIALKDNGATPDKEIDDGIYSAYFTSFSGNGRYGVIAKVSNEGQAKFKELYKHRRRTVRSTQEFDENDIVLDKFERMVHGGVFKVQNWDEEENDVIPPSRISDLQVEHVVHVTTKDKVIVLSWTSPGDDLNMGTATSLQLRYSEHAQRLRSSFVDCHPITETSLLNGSLTPVKAGEKQMISIHFESNKTKRKDAQVDAFYFAIIAVDEANNTGDLSNVAFAFVEKRHFEQRSSEIRTYLLKESKPILITVFLFFSFALFFLGILLIKLLSSQARRKKYEPLTYVRCSKPDTYK